MKIYSLKFNSGFATLPTILALGMLILAGGLAIAAISFSDNVTGSSQKNASLALTYAEAGAKDGLIRLSRNIGYACATTDCYSIDMTTSGCSLGTGCSKVQITNTGSPAIIVSKGEVRNITRKVQISVSYNANGEITSTTFSELTN